MTALLTTREKHSEEESSEKLILASASPRRCELLKLTGLDFEVLPSGVDETARERESPSAHVLRLSSEKALALANRYGHAWVLGADTIVVVNGEFLGKPADVQAARAMLEKLSGHEHQVFTGITLMCRAKGCVASEVVTSQVLFKDITAEEMDWYVSTPEPYDKAGGYALQGRGAVFVRELHGSYTNVIGLPLYETLAMLKNAGIKIFPGTIS